MRRLLRTARALARHPGYSLTVILAIALGIAAVTAVFQIVYATLWKPLPYSDADGIVLLAMTRPEAGTRGGRVSLPDVQDWRSSSRSLSLVAAISDESFVVTNLEPALRVPGVEVTTDFFDILGSRPALGNLAGWSEPDARVVVVSHRFWTHRLGRDAQVVGRRLVINDESYEILGVLPREVSFPRDVEIYAPLDTTSVPPEMRGARYLRAIARLAPEHSLTQAREELATLSQHLAATHPETNADQMVTPTPLREHLVGDLRPGLLLLVAAVGLVLLIVCTHLAGLVLARGTSRLDELRVRAALGATGWQIAGTLLLESLLLSTLGGLLGILAGRLASASWASLYPQSLPETADAGSPVVLGVSLAAALLAGLLFSLPATWIASRGGLRPASGRSTTKATVNRFTVRSQATILVAQLAITMALLVTAGTVLYSLHQLLAVDPGFTSQGLLTARVSLPPSRYPEPHQKAAFFRTLLERARALPGVEASAAATNLPLSGSNMVFAATVEGQPSDPELPPARYRAVSPGYFHALGVPVLEGREILAGDEPGARAVVVVNQTFVRHYLPHAPPLGQRILIPFGPGEPLAIVGVVADLRHEALDVSPDPEIYVPYMQQPWSFMSLVLRTKDPGRLVPMLQAAVSSLDADQPLDQVRTMDELVSASVARPRFFTVVLSGFAFLALLTAVVGMYGLTSFWVHLRLPEIGVRMALGADPRTIRRQFLRRPLLLAAGGTGLGVLLTLLLSRGVSGLLYGIEPANPWTLGGVSLFLLAVTLVAVYLPALRASRVEPIRVLRDE